MVSHATQPAGVNGAAITAPAVYSTEYVTPPTRRSVAAHVTAMLGILAGLWVAISPWFLTLQAGAGRSATAADLIVGLAVAALGVLAISGHRGFMGLQIASFALGIWLIISPFILAAKFPITAAMDWSNIWSGGVIGVLALASLAGLRRARAR